MASYIAWYGKKLARLQKQQEEFDKLLRETTEEPLLQKGAEAVRAAHVRALKAIRAQLAPSEKNAIACGNLDEEIRFWLSLTPEALIEGHRSGKLKGVRAARRAQAPTDAQANTSSDQH